MNQAVEELSAPIERVHRPYKPGQGGGILSIMRSIAIRLSLSLVPAAAITLTSMPALTQSVPDIKARIEKSRLIRDSASRTEWLRLLPTMTAEHRQQLYRLLDEDRIKGIGYSEEYWQALSDLNTLYNFALNELRYSGNTRRVETVDTDNPDALLTEIEVAKRRKDYKKARELRAKLFSIPVTDFSNNQLHQLATKASDQLYAETSELETICERTAQEIQRTSGEKQQALMELFEMCYNRFVFNPSTSEKGLHYILIKYAIQSGQSDKQTLLKQIAFNIRDAFLSVTALQSAGRYEEAADLLTFYFQTNPSLMDYKSDRVENFLAEANDLRNQGASAALDYYQNRVRVKQWEKRLDKILRVAVPVGIILWSSSEAEKEKERKAAEARAKAEEAARQRQIARDQENARRRTQGLPSLEEEERRESERREAIRGQTRTRCLENCATQYHSCMGLVDPRCCGPRAPYLPCIAGRCSTECETGLSSCRNKCD